MYFFLKWCHPRLLISTIMVNFSLQWGDSEPIMGAKYHTVHHTHYHYNFGQWFIFCDYIFGTLKVPEKDKYAREKPKRL